MTLKLYDELAEWWPLLSHPDDYEEEANVFIDAIKAHSRRDVRAVLELGSGGGNNASYLKQHWQMTLVDLSPGMLDVSRKLNPECEHIHTLFPSTTGISTSLLWRWKWTSKHNRKRVV